MKNISKKAFFLFLLLTIPTMNASFLGSSEGDDDIGYIVVDNNGNISDHI